MDDLLYLSEAAVAACCDVGALGIVDAIEAALRHSHDRTAPVAVILLDRQNGTKFIAKAGSLTEPAYTAVKWFGLNPRNREVSLPDYDPLILLSETSSGRPVALLSGRWITGVRTAALSAVAARRLSRPDAESIGFVGCGSQARHHLHMLRQLFPVRRVMAFSRTSASARSFCDDACCADLAAYVTQSARDAVSDVDVIVTSVPRDAAMGLKLRGEWTRPDAFVAMVDRGFSWDPVSLDAFRLALTDDVRLSGPGGPEDTIWGKGLSHDLADLIGGRISQFGAAGRSALAFSGTALADVATAALVYDRAVALGAGCKLPR